MSVFAELIGRTIFIVSLIGNRGFW